MVTVLAGLAEFERELIRAYTSEGRTRAKENGQSLGRKHKLTVHQRREAIQRRDASEPLGPSPAAMASAPAPFHGSQPEARRRGFHPRSATRLTG
jgi:hypothetical protein